LPRGACIFNAEERNASEEAFQMEAAMSRIFGIILGVCLGSAQATAAVNCSTQEVDDAFINQFVCDELLKCPFNNFKNLKELQSASDQEIRRHVRESAGETYDEIRNIGTPFASRWADYVENIQIDAIIAGKTVIRSVNAVATDYNPNIKRYTCEASLSFNDNSLRKIFIFYSLNALAASAENSVMLRSLLKMNRGDAFDLYHNMIENSADKLLGQFRHTYHFAVQPKDVEAWMSSDFVMSVHHNDNGQPD
jgi:hypothetical protein